MSSSTPSASRFLRAAVATTAVGLAAGALVACAQSGVRAPSAADLDAQARAMMQASFRDEGIAKVDRLKQDAAQAACSQAEPPSDEVKEKIQAVEAKTIRWPANGRYLGDWKEGEKLAQNGRGMTWTDSSTEPKANGGSCYNCHAIDPKEISFGTIGPSLVGYGKKRKVTDPTAASAQKPLQYAWAQIWNAKAVDACSLMPRFGAHGLLDEKQVADLMALLFDPASPVNQ